MANDELVRPVFMEQCPLFPCAVALAKCLPTDARTSGVTPLLAEDVSCEPLSWDACVGKGMWSEWLPDEAPTASPMPVIPSSSFSGVC